MKAFPVKRKETLMIVERMAPIISASTIGSTIQWFDFYLYSFLAVTVFPGVFFPSLSPLAGTVGSFGASFVGFAARPLGAILFGWFGDRVGRRSTLVSTLSLIGLATLLMGVLPDYATIGIAAPIALTLLRFIQGIGVGGEWGGATLLAMEYSDDRHRGFWTSWPQSSAALGLALASMAILLFKYLYPGEMYQSVGWRMPFLLSPLLLLVGFYIRLRISETPSFTRLQMEKREVRHPLFEVFRYYGRDVLLSALLRSADQAPFYLYSTFVISYGMDTLHLPVELLYCCLAIAAFTEFLLMPFVGRLSDMIGHKCCYLIGCIIMACVAFPSFWLLTTRVTGLVLLALMLAFDLGNLVLYAPQAALIAERFSSEVRYTGATLGFQLASVIAGGPAPFIATYLLANHGKLIPGIPAYAFIASFVIIMSIISFCAVLPLKEYTGKPPEERMH